MAGLKKSDLVARNAELRERIMALEEAMHGGILATALDAMAEGLADGAILVDASHRVTHFNRGAERLLGHAAGDVLGHSVARLFEEASAPACLTALAAAPAAGDLVPARAAKVSLVARRRDGASVPVQVTVTGWRQPAGAVRALLFRDLTPLQAAADAGRAIENRLEALAEAAPVGIFSTDLQGRCLYVSTRWKQITGLDEADALGDRWMVSVHPEDRAGMVAAWQDAVESGAPVSAEYRMIHTDGRELWVLGQAAPVRDAGDRITGYVGTITDISRQKSLERTLRLREASFRVLFQDNPLPMWVYDLETLRFLEVNEAACAVYGYPREEWLRMTLMDIRPAEDQARLLDDLSRPRAPFERSAQWRHRRKDGTVVPVEFASHTIHFEGRDAVLVSVLSPVATAPL
ncbi:MAG TPA: PAS domain S-box protein [Gemmatimonadales bacterium]|nr:PAS domain S-box protein [Gemmatimonadales bacterium]